MPNPRFALTSSDAARFEGVEHSSLQGAPFEMFFAAGYPLFLIKEAWNRGVDFEDLADGFGAGMGTCGEDWSGIRDSSPDAVTQMLERSLNALFPTTEAT